MFFVFFLFSRLSKQLQRFSTSEGTRFTEEQKVSTRLFFYHSSRRYFFQPKNVDSFLGPVVQSIVSLTSSLRVISLTVLADSIYNFLIFFAEKM